MRPEHDPSSQNAEQDLAHLDAAGLRLVFKFGDDLGLDSKEIRALLGGISASKYTRWRAHPDKAIITADTRQRQSLLAGVWKDLFSLFGGDSDRALAWFKRPNTAAPFQGGTALERLFQGGMGDLIEVRRYVGAAKGGYA